MGSCACKMAQRWILRACDLWACARWWVGRVGERRWCRYCSRWLGYRTDCTASVYGSQRSPPRIQFLGCPPLSCEKWLKHQFWSSPAPGTPLSQKWPSVFHQRVPVVGVGKFKSASSVGCRTSSVQIIARWTSINWYFPSLLHICLWHCRIAAKTWHAALISFQSSCRIRGFDRSLLQTQLLYLPPRCA